MSRRRKPDDPFDSELAQHEVSGRLHWFDVDRRRFLQVLGGGVLVCIAAPAARGQESGRSRSRELPQEISAWLHIAEDGRVTAFTGKVEVGQNIRTSLAQQVAEELHVPVDAIRFVMGDTDRTPWDAGTFGSRTTPTMGPQMRAVAAAAREAIVGLAAQRWNMDRAGLAAEGGKVVNPKTGQALPYGELTKGQSLVRLVGAQPELTKATDWKVAGTSVPKVDGRDFVTGRHQYTSDLSRPGMLHGKVLRPAGFQATLVSVDTAAAKAIGGVTVVQDGDFVGVAAPDLTSAERALAAVSAQWKTTPQPSNKDLWDYLKKNVEPGERAEQQVSGSVEDALASAEVKLEKTYTVAYIAHAPLEPRAAVAEWNGDKLTVWTGTQRPFAVRRSSRRPSAFPPRRCASSCPTPARPTAASTRATRRSRPRASRRPPASR